MKRCEQCDTNILEPVVYSDGSIEMLVFYACTFLGVSITQILGKRRFRPVVQNRQMIHAYLTERNFTLKAIARYFNKDHTSILYSRDTVRDLCSTDSQIAEKYRIKERYEELKNYLNNFQ